MFYTIINRKMKKFLYNTRRYTVILSLYSRNPDDFGRLEEFLRMEPFQKRVAGGGITLRIAAPVAPVAVQLPDIPLAGMGWSGACFSSLTRQEIEWEARWTRRNPWGTGLEQLLERPLNILHPRRANPEDLRVLQDRFAYLLCGSETETLLYRNGEPHPQHIPTLTVGSPNLPQAGGTILLHQILPVDFDTAAAETLHHLILQLEANGAAPVALTDISFASPGGAGDRMAVAESSTPLIEEALRHSRITPARRSRTDLQERHRFVLSNLGLLPENTAPASAMTETASPKDSIESLGSMVGRALFHDEKLHVTTLGGRLAGLVWNDTTLLPLHRAQGYIVSNGKTTYLEMKAAHAFEIQNVHGVLEESDLGGIQCDQRIYIAEGYQALLYRVEAVFPSRWVQENPVSRFSLLRLFLGTADDSFVIVKTWYPDGSHRLWDIPNRPGFYTVTGSTIQFPEQFGELSIAGIEAIVPMTLEVRRGAHAPEWYLHPFLEGRNVDLRRYQGYRFTMTISLGRSLAPEGTIFALPPAVKRSALPYSFQRISPE